MGNYESNRVIGVLASLILLTLGLLFAVNFGLLELDTANSWTEDECAETKELASTAADDFVAQNANGIDAGSAVYAFGAYSSTAEKAYQYTVVESTEDGGWKRATYDSDAVTFYEDDSAAPHVEKWTSTTCRTSNLGLTSRSKSSTWYKVYVPTGTIVRSYGM